jgi:exodeoxyribonuclease VII large subunit
MLQILQRRAPGLRLFVRGVRVQGPEAAPEIADAIAAFSAEHAVDLVVVARGGGSMEDLWAFNEEVVARALAACSVPTISAVGHETDFTIADFVADLRAPTPSAAAELLTRDWSDWRQEIAALGARLERNVRQVLVGHRRHLAQFASSYALREPLRVVRQFSQRLDELRESLHGGAEGALESRRQNLQRLAARLKNRHPARELAQRRAHLAHLVARLRTLGPQGTLDRGYALVLDAQGRPVSKAAKALEGKSVRLVLAKGTAEAQVTDTQPEATLQEALGHGKSSTSARPKTKKSRSKTTPASEA